VCGDAGEQGKFEQEDTERAKHAETPDAAIAHDFQFSFARPAAEQAIAGIHQAVEM